MIGNIGSGLQQPPQPINLQNTQRVQQPSAHSAAVAGTLAQSAKNPYAEEVRGIKTEQTREEQGYCKSCSERRYMDESDDSGVSFQAPTKVSAGRSAQAVYSHEREHYVREGAKAERENREVVSNTISVFYSICPECGRKYASGGETRTVTKAEQEPQQPEDATNPTEKSKTVDVRV